MPNVEDRVLAALSRIAELLDSDEYEISDPLTMGGAAGLYQIRNPYNTECEWSMVSATSGTTAASYVVGSKNPIQANLGFANADVLAPAGYSDNNPLQSYVGSLTTQAPTVTYTDAYMPLAGNGTVYLRVVSASGEALITIRFRRKLEKWIPTIQPLPKPSTHTPLSARNARTFMQGFRDDSTRMGHPMNPRPQEDTQRSGAVAGGGGRSNLTGGAGVVDTKKLVAQATKAKQVLQPSPTSRLSKVSRAVPDTQIIGVPKQPTKRGLDAINALNDRAVPPIVRNKNRRTS